MRIYGYLRASTKEQDANRARETLADFIKSRDLTISAWFAENESGATLKRPKLFRLLEIAEKGDVLLVEQVDRITRLNSDDWESLKTTINTKAIRIVALDLPTSHEFLNTGGGSDQFTGRMIEALNAMLLDMLAAIARKDYEDRRRRQLEGQKRAMKQGKYKGRQPDIKKHERIRKLLKAGISWREICDTVPCSTSTIQRVKKMARESF